MGRNSFLYAPPGLDVRKEKRLFFGVLAFGILWSLGFLPRFFSARESLYRRWTDSQGNLVKVLQEGAEMPRFAAILDDTFLFFAVGALGLLLAVGVHYCWYRMGSRSIDLMRRLPNRGLLHRQCWALPLVGFGILAATGLLLLGLYWLVYVKLTPVGCLPEVQGRFFSCWK